MGAIGWCVCVCVCVWGGGGGRLTDRLANSEDIDQMAPGRQLSELDLQCLPRPICPKT